MEKVAPTAAELEILNILWKKEPLTVKDIHDLISVNKSVGYTTTLKIMQKMTTKGLLHRKANGKSHLYYSSYKKEETRGRLLDRFVDSTFGGSASSLVMQLLGNKTTSKEEISEIKKIIEQMENESNS
ncbi:BlaI/MecI/CopY family transcriptional regulator [Plebeiibacterium marinum]|uniref:BlaI/MecI/CopY family transcriptional regulator n=1 Tax=Plebeiibacterium marinum TaxID=2992111 RepID=A0AAE3SK51_9BACT|nr:BlaI/MecI/CopY family transcriptional regulator [Plebeiobacterium marinum]MCW3806199.1 BlaI/MecI/CopY family transcriptional regulator [Plebeiobacterium marinum]